MSIKKECWPNRGPHRFLDSQNKLISHSAVAYFRWVPCLEDKDCWRSRLQNWLVESSMSFPVSLSLTTNLDSLTNSDLLTNLGWLNRGSMSWSLMNRRSNLIRLHQTFPPPHKEFRSVKRELSGYSRACLT